MRAGVKDTNVAGLYILLAALTIYFCQNFFHLPDITAQAVLALVMLYGGVCMVKIYFTMRIPGMMVWASMMLIMLWFGWILGEKSVHSPYMGDMDTLVMAKNSSLFFIMLFVGYTLGKRMVMTPQRVSVAAISILLIAIVHYILCIRMAEAAGIDIRLTSNNGAYCFVSVLPFLVPLFFSRKKLFTILFFTCLVFILLSGKRGAMVCVIIAIAYFYQHYLSMRKEHRWKAILALFSVLLCIVSIAINEYIENEYFRQRVETTINGYTSGRDTIYATLVDYMMYELNSVELMLGKGIMHSVIIAGNYAHCDWLELAVDFGFVGVFLYLAFYISFISYIRKIQNRTPDYITFTMKMIMLILFTASMFSMGFIAIFNSFDMMLLGILMANSRHSHKINIHTRKISN